MADEGQHQEDDTNGLYPVVSKPTDYSADETYNYALRGNGMEGARNQHTELSIHPTLEARVQQNIRRSSTTMEYQHIDNSSSNNYNQPPFGISGAEVSNMLDEPSAQFSNR